MDLWNSWRTPKVKAINQLFLYLVWLRIGFTLQQLSWLFDISIPTASRYIITWAINFVGQPDNNWVNTCPSLLSESIDPLDALLSVPSYIAEIMIIVYIHTIRVTWPTNVRLVFPSRSITFTSQLFENSISEREIVSRTGFLESFLWNVQDSVIADREFAIFDELKSWVGLKIFLVRFWSKHFCLQPFSPKDSVSLLFA